MSILSALILLVAATAPDLVGSARVIDGDTLEVSGQRVRLQGIDAPDAGQVCDLHGEAWACRQAPTDLLRELIGDEDVECRSLGNDKYGRIIAKCKVDWLDLGAEMVTRGMAIACLRYSQDYLRNYREARGKGNGIFAGIFIEPEKWRQGERLDIELANDNQPNDCRMKGNISRSGERIYYILSLPKIRSEPRSDADRRGWGQTGSGRLVGQPAGAGRLCLGTSACGCHCSSRHMPGARDVDAPRRR